MGKRGPKKTPTAVLRLTGSREAGRRGDDLHAAGRPEAPAWLNPEETAVFDAVADRLAGLPGLLDRSDAEALAVFAQAVVEHRALCRIVKEEGFWAVTADGTPKTHPAVNARQMAWTRVRAGLAQFGLTPADRAGLKIEAPAGNGGKMIGLGGGL